MNKAGKRLQRQKQEDAAYNKLLVGLAAMVCLELVTLLLKRLYIECRATAFELRLSVGLNSFFQVFRVAGIVLVIVGCVWTLLAHRKGSKLALPLVCAGVVTWLWLVSVLCYGFNAVGMTLMCAIPVAAAVLCGIYFIYQREFFFCACLGGVGIAAIWLLRHAYVGLARTSWCIVAVVCVVMAAAAVLARKVAGKDGMLGKVRILPGKAVYTPVYLTCAVTALAVVLSMVLNVATIGYYLFFALVGWLFCLAVYYTVKLM